MTATKIRSIRIGFRYLIDLIEQPSSCGWCCPCNIGPTDRAVDAMNWTPPLETPVWAGGAK